MLKIMRRCPHAEVTLRSSGDLTDAQLNEAKGVCVIP